MTPEREQQIRDVSKEAFADVKQRTDKMVQLDNFIYELLKQLDKERELHEAEKLSLRDTINFRTPGPLAKFRMRSLLHQNGYEAEAGVVLESTGNLKDWLIVTFDADTLPDADIRRLRRMMRERFGPKVLVLPNDIQFVVFEKVEAE